MVYWDNPLLTCLALAFYIFGCYNPWIWLVALHFLIVRHMVSTLFTVLWRRKVDASALSSDSDRICLQTARNTNGHTHAHDGDGSGGDAASIVPMYEQGVLGGGIRSSCCGRSAGVPLGHIARAYS